MGNFNYCASDRTTDFKRNTQRQRASQQPVKINFLETIKQIESLFSYESKLKYLHQFLPKPSHHIGSFDIMDFNNKETAFFFQSENVTQEQLIRLERDFRCTTQRELSQIFQLTYLIYVSEAYSLYCAPFQKQEEEFKSLEDLLVIVQKYLETDRANFIWFKVKKRSLIPFFYAHPLLQSSNISEMNPYVAPFFQVLQQFFTEENIGELNDYIRKSGSIFNQDYHTIRSIAPVVNRYFMEHFEYRIMDFKQTFDALIKCLQAFEVGDTKKLMGLYELSTVNYERTLGLFTKDRRFSSSLTLIPERILKKQKILDFYDLLEYSLFLQQKKIFSLGKYLFVELDWNNTKDSGNRKRLLGIEVKKEAQIPPILLSQIYEVQYFLKLKLVVYEETELFQQEMEQIKSQQYNQSDMSCDSVTVFRNASVLVFEVINQKKRLETQ